MYLERYGPHSGVLDHDTGAALADLLAVAKGRSATLPSRQQLYERTSLIVTTVLGFGEWLFSAIPR